VGLIDIYSNEESMKKKKHYTGSYFSLMETVDFKTHTSQDFFKNLCPGDSIFGIVIPFSAL